MALVLYLRYLSGIEGEADRFCTLTFRGVQVTSKILINCSGEIFFNEEFSWPLETPLDKSEWLEVRLFNRKKNIQDSFVGVYRLSLAIIYDGGSAELLDNLIDSEHNILRAEVHMEVSYSKLQ